MTCMQQGLQMLCIAIIGGFIGGSTSLALLVALGAMFKEK